MSDYDFLASKVSALEKRIDALSAYLQSALEYLETDPASSLTKSRIVLERILTTLFEHEMHRLPSRPMIGDMLADKEFSAKIPRRILARITSIKEMANLGPHGGDVESQDAVRVMRDLIDVLEWFVINYDFLFSHGSTKTEEARVETLEILPQLREKYSEYLRPNIKSVKLGQVDGRCFLEVTTAEIVAGYLHNEVTKREDLGFVSDDAPTKLYFNPSNTVIENAHRFVTDFDEISIINCTELFTDAAAGYIYDYWYQHGKTPRSI